MGVSRACKMEKKLHVQAQPKREVLDGLKSILEWDKKITRKTFDVFDKKFGYLNYRSQMKWLENSCHGIPWLIGKVDPTGVDKFSFPSGHASRAGGFFFFFWFLYPLNFLLRIPILIWSSAVAVSRVFLCRHHILDVAAGIVLSYVEYIVMCFLWMGEDRATYLLTYLGGEDPWSS